jgi:hypothetical protein
LLGPRRARKVEKVKATLQVELQPFQTPDFVRAVGEPGLKQDGMQEFPGYPLSDLDPLTLDQLCRRFRNEVFLKAGKAQPPEEGCRCT